MSRPVQPRSHPIHAAAWWLRILCALILAASTLCLSVPPAYGATASLSVGSIINYANWNTNIFTVNGNEAFCGEPDKPTPSSGNYAMEAINDRLAASALWFGYGGGGFDKGLWPQSYYNGAAMGANEYRVLTHVALAYLRTSDVAYACTNANLAFRSWCEQNLFGATASGAVVNANAICQRIKTEGFTIGGASESRDTFPKGFTAYRFATSGGAQIMYTSTYVPHGWVELTKASGNPTVSDGNACYSLEGAQYGLYADEACTQLVTTLTTNADGWARSEQIPCDTYFLKEISAPSGYALSDSVQRVRVPVRAAIQVSTTDLPQNNLVDLVVQKKDVETGQPKAQGGAALKDAEYLLRFFGGSYDTVEEAETACAPLRSWTVRTDNDGCAYLDEDHLVAGDELFRDSAGFVCLPLGTIVITEAKAPAGYLLNSEPIICAITSEGTAEHVSTFSTPDHYEQVARGDLELVKVRESDQKHLAGIPFLLTSHSTGESHLIVTDDNGHANTSAAFNSHEEKTNANDEALNRDGSIDESKLDANAGIWFGTSRPNDDHGALIYDKYRLEELRCSANEGLELITLPSIAITRDGYRFDAGTLDDQPESTMHIRTTARDDSDGDKELSAEGQATIIDRVEYSNLAVGENYLMWGTLMCRSTGEAILDENGSSVSTQLPFTTEEANGYVELAFTVDASAYPGEDIVVCEDLIDAESGATITSDFDLDNYEETVSVSGPPTTPAPTNEAKLGKTGDGSALAAAALGICTMALLGAWMWRRYGRKRARQQRTARLMGNLMR